HPSHPTTLAFIHSFGCLTGTRSPGWYSSLCTGFGRNTWALTWTARVGFLVAILLGVTALLTTEGIYAGYLVALAFFCGFCCQRELNRMRFTESELEVLDHEELGTWAPEDREEGVVGRINAPGGGVHPDGTAEERAAVDRILDKIRSGGMKSLSRAERRLLKRASKRRRRP
ncbi:MAG: DUF6576 domain-containing protein, partial [Planctomycetota bacterium]|nr:DUF6576 domain-containing protein [Planctomycetota bacterium]